MKNLTLLDLSRNQFRELPVEIIHLKNLTKLSLAGNQLSSLPAEIIQLKNLTDLYLSRNQISSLPAEIIQLKNLTGLDLSRNQLSSLPVEIFQLENLKVLNLAGNRISSLPAEIFQLKNLIVLNLARNQIGSLRAEIIHLKNLKTLDLSRNQLMELPVEIGELINLTKISLAFNQIVDVSCLMGLKNLRYLDLVENRISELPREIANVSARITWKRAFSKDRGDLSGIYLQGNPLESPPIEIVKQGNEAVKSYFKFIETKEISRVYEAKLLIVGEGGVGKTCIMKRLMDPEKEIDQNELTTEGIDINQWIIDTDKAKDFKVNFWDFGGQEIYHATHQFFLTKRSLYLFVWEARKDYDITSFDYWLNVINLLSDSSPVIVVLNKIDERIKSIDEKSLQEKFVNIVCFDKVSALKGTRIKDLIKIIKEQISNLPHIGDVLPTVWVDIRKKLESIEKNFISYDEYKEICGQLGLNKETSEFLSRYYHDLGVFLHFLDNPILREIVFLKPDWATNAVYKVVDTREIQHNYGKFQFQQLKKIWRDYPEDKYAHLLELMKKFEICFQIPNTQTYIVPELLRPSTPDFEWNYGDNLRFEYRYDFMPAGIITRFIIRTNDIIKKEIYWKNGVVLQRENTEALVISERLNRKIRIWVRGAKKKELLAIIRRELDYIHNTLNDPDVAEMIPCICSQCATVETPYFYEYETLCRFRSKGKNSIECKESTEDVQIDRLLGDYERPEDKRKAEYCEREYVIGKIEVSPHIEISPKIEQKPTIEIASTGTPKKNKWWLIITGIIILLGGIWSAIRICESKTFRDIMKTIFAKTKTEQIHEEE